MSNVISNILLWHTFPGTKLSICCSGPTQTAMIGPVCSSSTLLSPFVSDSWRWEVGNAGTDIYGRRPMIISKSPGTSGPNIGDKISTLYQRLAHRLLLIVLVIHYRLCRWAVSGLPVADLLIYLPVGRCTWPNGSACTSREREQRAARPICGTFLI